MTRATSRGIAWDTMLILILVAMSPLLAAPLLNVPLLGPEGPKVRHLLSLIGALAFLQGLPENNKLERRAYISFVLYAAFILVVYLRSVPNVPLFHAQSPEIVPRSVPKYLLGDYALPMLVAASFLYILRRMSRPEDIERIVLAVVLACAATSLVVLAAVFMNPGVLFNTDREAVHILLENALALHYNEIGTILAVAAPLALFVLIRRGSFWSLPYLLAAAAILATKSRTGILVFAGGSVATMVALGRVRDLIAWAPVAVLGALAVLGAVLENLLTIGATQKSGLSLYLLLSGREEAIWLPAVLEWARNPSKLLFGAGAHGIHTSVLIYSGATGYIPGHSHNMYLEFFLDNGIVLFGAFLAVIAAGLRTGWRTGRRIRSGLYWSLYLCIVSYFVMGLSGRFYYPTPENFLLFPILAVLINIARLRIATQTTTLGKRPWSGRTQHPQAVSAANRTSPA